MTRLCALLALLFATHSVAAQVVSGSAAQSNSTSRQVEVIVTDIDGHPLRDAIVNVTVEGTPSRRQVTDAFGHAVVSDVPRGLMTLVVRRLGFAPLERWVSLDGVRSVVSLSLVASRSATLDSFRVMVTHKIVGRSIEFDSRLLGHQAAVAITHEEITRRNPSATWRLLTNVTALNVAKQGTMIIARSRGSISAIAGKDPCPVRVAVDGVVISMLPARAKEQGFDLRVLPSPDEIYGIEVFTVPASVPVRYRGGRPDDACSLIVVTTL